MYLSVYKVITPLRNFSDQVLLCVVVMTGLFKIFMFSICNWFSLSGCLYFLLHCDYHFLGLASCHLCLVLLCHALQFLTFPYFSYAYLALPTLPFFSALLYLTCPNFLLHYCTLYYLTLSCFTLLTAPSHALTYHLTIPYPDIAHLTVS